MSVSRITLLIMAVGCTAALLAAPSEAAPADEEVLLFNFRTGLHGWSGNPRVANVRHTEEGMRFETTGVDPWVECGPVADMPMGARVLLTIRMRAEGGDGSAEVFFGPDFGAENGRQFITSTDGQWEEYEILLPEQEEGTRLRLDPCVDCEAEYTIAWIKAKPLRPLMKASFERPKPVEFPQVGGRIKAGAATLIHNGMHWNGFALDVEGYRMAAAHAAPRIGYMHQGEPAYLDLRNADFSLREEGGMLIASAQAADKGGAKWNLERRFETVKDGVGIGVSTSVTVDQARDLFHLPWITLFPGLDNFGADKTQALLPGVEYLADEPSSNEADIRGEKANRLIVEDYKLCYPMMALTQAGRYMGLVWRRDSFPAPLFDTPDRVFESGGHVMGLWYPGVGSARLENALDIFNTIAMEAGETWDFDFTLFGCRGNTVTDAIEHYISLRGAPDVPEFEGGLKGAAELLAHGWLDSDLHGDGQWKHAVWGHYTPIPAADAPAYMHWLATHVDDEALAGRLRKGAARGIENLPEGSAFGETVSHVVRPVPPMVFGQVERYTENLVAQAREWVKQFEPNGIFRYHPAPGRPDYSETHWATHANGHASTPLERILGVAAFSGDEALIEQGLSLLDKNIALYRETVPRGAQTWECALHMPDILASGRIVHCLVLGYLLSGDAKYLEEARYWAWTGLAMVYLDHPVKGPVGTYATTGVIGATGWVAPYWIGQPVQWCGLVYRSALLDLSEVLEEEEAAFWRKIANGITASGLQQTFPLDDEKRQGLLPDYFHLHAQISDGPAINPGTVQSGVPELYGVGRFYDVARLGDSGVLVHAPGAVETTGTEGAVRIEGWPEDPYDVVVARVKNAPAAEWNGKAVDVQFNAELGQAVIRVQGQGDLVLK